MVAGEARRAGGGPWRLRRVLLAGAMLLGGWGAAAPARAEAPPERMAVLARGVNIAHWFRFPLNGDLHALQTHMDDAAVAALRQAGFTFVRLPVGPEVVMQQDRIEPPRLAAVVQAIRRLQRAGLGVMVEPHPQNVGDWNLQQSAAARQRLLGFWRDLAPALARLPPALTFPEVVNEPGFEDAAAWGRMQGEILGIIRAAMPGHTVALTGTNWSSIDGLLRVTPVADPNVVYTFHSYEPQLLALLANWEPGVDSAALGRLPFPVADRGSCEASTAGIQHPRTRELARYWCSGRQDAGTIAGNLGRAAAWGRQHRVSVALTEFGAAPGLNAAARLAYLEAVRRAAEQHGMPWALWALDDRMGFGIPPGQFNAGTRLDQGVLRALGLPPGTGPR